MRWMWIDRVIELVPGIKLVAIKNVSMAEEHLHDHFAAEPPGAHGLPDGPPDGRSASHAALPVMPASLIVEGCAQTAGMLMGQTEGFKYNVILAKVNKFTLERDAVPGCTLRYSAVLERIDALGASVIIEIAMMDHGAPLTGFVPVGSMAVMLSHLDNNMGSAGIAGEDFPAHNFVFGPSFKTLLASSGVQAGL